MVTKEEKYRRKRLLMDFGDKSYPNRTEIDNRKFTPYRIAHACFACRKSYKILVDFLDIKDGYKCPQCAGRLEYMGRSFKAPKHTDGKQWEKIKLLFDAGFLFSSYRSFPDAETLPETLREVEDFIIRNPNHPMRVLP